MRTLPAHRGILPVLAASALVLAGCGDDGGSTAEASGGPLEEYLGAGSFMGPMGMMGGVTFSDEEFEMSDEELQQMRDTEEFVSQCMSDEGFEYTPYVFNPDEVRNDPWTEAYSLPPDEFAEQYGYGISTMRFQDIEQDLPQDPNQEFRDSLSPEAQQAYERALYGDMMAWEGDEPPPVEERGCYGIAAAEIYDEDPYEAGYDEANDPWMKFESLMNDVSALSGRIQSDPRVEEAQQAYFDCMADAGQPDLEYIGQAQDPIYQRMSELEGWDEIEALYESGDFEEADELQMEFEPREIDPQELAELQELEIDTAVADYTCMDEHYAGVYTEVSHALQEEFITEHRAELEIYRDWAEENNMQGSIGFG